MKIASIVLLAASAAVQFIVAATTTTFDLRATTASVARTGPADSSGFPGLEITQLTPINTPYVYAAANLFAALAYVFSLFFESEENDYSKRGTLPFFWFAVLFGGVPLIIALALTEGIAAWTELFTVTALWASVAFLYWVGAYMNSKAYIEAVVDNAFSWAAFVMAFVSFAVVNIVLYVAFSNLVDSSNPASVSALYIIPLVAFSVIALLLLLWPIFAFCGCCGITGDTHTVWLYVLNTLLVLVVSWTAMIVFATDDITYP